MEFTQKKEEKEENRAKNKRNRHQTKIEMGD